MEREKVKRGRILPENQFFLKKLSLLKKYSTEILLSRSKFL